MMKIKVLFKKPSKRQFFVWGLAFLVASCASQNEEAVFSPQKLSKNPYFQFYQQQVPEYQKLLSTSAFHLLRGSDEVFLESVSLPQSAQGFFRSFATPFVHGDFHADQMAKIEGQDSLDDLDTSDWAPFWIDLVRQESSELVLANELSLKTYTPGACVDAYLETFSPTPTLSTAPTPGPKPLPKPYFGKGPEVERNPAKPSTPYIPKPWTTGTPSDLSAELNTALLSSYKNLFPDKKFKDVRKVQSGVGSYLATKYMVQSTDNFFVEFKELDAAPLKKLRRSPKSGSLKPCERFLMAAKLFRPQSNLQCTVIGSKSYSVIPYLESYQSAKLKNISDPRDLQSHAAWMCEQLARVHQKTWTPQDIQTLVAAWQSNPLLKERLIMLARNDAELLAEAYRMILESKVAPIK